MKVVNLSRRRFVNVRPVTRTTVVLWLVGALLIATNLFLYFQYWVDSVEIRSQRAQTLDLIDQQRDAIRDINRRFDRLDISAQNNKVEFLNTLIHERTFPWSQLFDDLEDVLIPDARVVLVQPKIEVEKKTPPRRRPIVARRTRSRATASEKEEAPPKPPEESQHLAVQLSLNGFVKDDQALANLVDAFYAHPSFEKPYLSGESTDTSSGGLAFNIEVTYLLPKQPPATIELPEETVTAETPAAGTPSEDAPPQAASASKAEPPAEPDTEAPSTEERAGAGSSEEVMTESLRQEPDDGAAAATPPARPPAATLRNRPPTRLQPEVPAPRVAVPPAAGTPAGTPRSAGPPVAAPPTVGTRLAVPPAAGTPATASPDAAPPAVSAPQTPSRTAPSLRPPGAPSAPANPPRLAAPDSPRAPSPPPTRPKFIGPEATGTPRLSGRGGSR